jgi:ankyrin repeat protein
MKEYKELVAARDNNYEQIQLKITQILQKAAQDEDLETFKNVVTEIIEKGLSSLDKILRICVVTTDRTEIISYLLDKKPNVNALALNYFGNNNNYGLEFNSTPLDLAVYHNHRKVVDLLLQNGASFITGIPLRPNVDDIIPLEGQNYLQKKKQDLIEAINNGTLDEIKLFVAQTKGWLALPLNAEGETALHSAVKGGKEDIVSYLLESGVTLDVLAKLTPEHSKTSSPLHFAVYYDHQKVVDLLLKNGAELSPDRVRAPDAIETLSRVPNYLATKKNRLLQAVQKKDIATIKSFFDENEGWMSLSLNNFGQTVWHMVAICSPGIFGDLAENAKARKDGLKKGEAAMDGHLMVLDLINRKDTESLSPKDLYAVTVNQGDNLDNLRVCGLIAGANKAYFNSLVCLNEQLLNYEGILNAIRTGNQAIEIIKKNPNTIGFLLGNDKVKTLLKGALEKIPDLIAELIHYLPESEMKSTKTADATAKFFIEIITGFNISGFKTKEKALKLKHFFREHPFIFQDKQDQLLSQIQETNPAEKNGPANAALNTSIKLLSMWLYELKKENKATKELVKAINDQIDQAEILRDYIRKIDSAYLGKVDKKQLDELAMITLESVQDTIYNDDPLYDECDLLLMANPPQERDLESLPSNAYIRVGENQLLYVDKTSKKCIQLDITSKQLHLFDQEMEIKELRVGQPLKLSVAKLCCITSITGHITSGSKIGKIVGYHQRAQRIVADIEKLDPHHTLKNVGKCVAVFACGLIGLAVLGAIAVGVTILCPPVAAAVTAIAVAAATTKGALLCGAAAGLLGYLSGAAGSIVGHYAFFGKSAPEKFFEATKKVIQKQNENADQDAQNKPKSDTLAK